MTHKAGAQAAPGADRIDCSTRVAKSGVILDAAVIGCGRVGGDWPAAKDGSVLCHAAAYDRHDGFRLVACIEPDKIRRQAFMTRWHVEHGHASLEEAVASGLRFDIASVCTPTARHATDLRALLKTSARAVWCEKPLTGSASESELLVAAYRSAGKHLAVNYLRRWHPEMQRLRSDIAGGIWGAVRSVVGFYTKGVRNNGSHMIDLVQFLIGPVRAVSVAAARCDHDRDDPTVDALLRGENGISVHIVGGDAGDYALFELEIVAERGAIRIERSGRTMVLRRPIDDPDVAGYRVLDDGERIELGAEDVFLRAADNLYSAVVDDAPLASNGATALAAEWVCDALVERAAALRGDQA